MTAPWPTANHSPEHILAVVRGICQTAIEDAETHDDYALVDARELLDVIDEVGRG